MRLLLAVRGIYPAALGGAQRHSFELAHALSRRGVVIDIIHPHAARLFDGCPWINEEYPLNVPAGKFYCQLLYARKVARVVRAKATTYSMGYSDGISLLYYAPDREFPCVYNPHGIPLLQYGHRFSLRRLVDAHFGYKMAASSDIVISLGGKLTHLIRRELRVPAERIALVPNGVPERCLTDLPSPQHDSPRLFLFVGTLNKHKGAEYLVRAANDRRLRDAHFVFIGSGSLQQHLRANVQHKNVRFLGQIENTQELHEWYKKADCLVAPSTQDGMPTVILEAMAHGLPIIASDVGAISVMVDHEENGILVAPGSTDSLVEALIRFRDSHKAVREGYATRSLLRARDFTWDRVAELFLEHTSRILPKTEG